MFEGLSTFLIALGAVTLAEMGDKTQLLAMCFATRFSAKKVLIGVFIATILNHALAVAAGYFLREILSQYTIYIQLVASLSFIGFALWTIRGDKVDDSCDTKKAYGPVVTVAIAFFIAEMGDKTQLATVSLAAGFNNPIAILMGTTLGMLVADGIGIIFGVVMNKKIPEKTLKWISAGVFAICGLIGYVESARQLMSKVVFTFSVLLVILVSTVLTIYIHRANRNEGVFDEIACLKERKTPDVD